MTARSMSERLAYGLGSRIGCDDTRAVRHHVADLRSYVHTEPYVRAAYEDGYEWWVDYTAQRAQERAQ